MKLLKASLVMVALICLIGVAGCADDDPVAIDTGSTGVTGSAGPAANLAGTWVSSCLESPYYNDKQPATNGCDAVKRFYASQAIITTYN